MLLSVHGAGDPPGASGEGVWLNSGRSNRVFAPAQGEKSPPHSPVALERSLTDRLLLRFSCQILPYLYVRYNASPNTSSAEHNVYLRKLAHSIDAALHLCHQPNKGVERRSASTLKARFVHQCTLVRAKPFYGFHKSEEFFAKVRDSTPRSLVSRCCC